MDIFLEMFCLFAVGTQSYSFASVGGIDGCCLELQCYTFLIFNRVRAFVSSASVCGDEDESEGTSVFLKVRIMNERTDGWGRGLILMRAILE